MANDLYNYAVKGVVDSVIRWNDGTTNHTLALPIAAGGNFNRQPELLRLTTSNCRALKVTAKRVEIGEDPVCSLQFGALTMPLLSLKQNRRWESTASAAGIYFRSGFDVPADGVVPALTTGYLGFGITADPAGSTASYVDANGLSTDLTLGTYATFDAVAAPLGWAVGANGAMKFGQTLWNKSVSFEIPVTYTNFQKLGSLPYTSMSLRVRAALVNLQVYEWLFPSVSINTEGETPFAATEEFNLDFYVESDYTVQLYGKLAPC